MVVDVPVDSCGFWVLEVRGLLGEDEQLATMGCSYWGAEVAFVAIGCYLALFGALVDH